jgi:hypothetical protein
MESYEVKEVWKDVPGYEGLYQVSSLGRVKSLSRRIDYKGWPYYRIAKEIIMKESISSNGYKFVVLRKDGKPKNIRTHQLIAMSFLNHNPNGNNMVIDHIDGDKLNNNLLNLRVIHNRINISKGMRPNGFTGVHERRGKFRSMIRVNNKLIHLGTYSTPEEARDIYNNYFKKVI